MTDEQKQKREEMRKQREAKMTDEQKQKRAERRKEWEAKRNEKESQEEESGESLVSEDSFEEETES